MRNPGRVRRRGLAAVALLAVAACGGRSWVADFPDVAERARARPEAFVEPTFDRSEGLTTLSGAYQLRAARGVGRRTFDLAVSVQRPDRIDISVLDPAGGIQAYLRADPEQVGLYFAEDRVLYLGAATREAFERALGLGLSAADVVALFLGYGLEREGRPPGEPGWDEDRRRVRIDYGPGATLWLHPVERLFDRVEHRAGGGRVTAELLEWSAVEPELGESAPGAAFPVPAAIEMRVEPDGIGLQLRSLAAPRLNHELPASVFEVQRVPGAQVLPLEELTRQGGLFQRTRPDEQ